jgi:cytochrome c biogenesis protein CcmG/thiol:disulfide interchange protein DsbE
MNRKLILILVGLIVITGGYWYGRVADTGENKSPTSNDSSVRVGKVLTPFTLVGLDGSSVTLGQPGKITVINFWATWCPPCQEEMPEMEAFATHNREKVDFYAVNLKESQDKIRDFMNKNKYTMPVLLDKEGEIGAKFQISAIPTTVIINKHGMIKYRKSGGMTRSELEGIINSL